MCIEMVISYGLTQKRCQIDVIQYIKDFEEGEEMTKNRFILKYKDILYVILWICLRQGAISDYIGFKQINYLCDFLLLALLIIKIVKNGYRISCANIIVYIPLILFAFVVLIGWLFNPVPILMALWGTRNYGRFFLYFMFCLSMQNEIDISKIENAFIKLFPAHIILVAYQYVVEGLAQDNLSGIFGKSTGGNGGLMIYLVIVLNILIAQYEYKKISLLKFAIYLLFIFINAALSELKFMFIMAVIIIAWYFLMSKRKGRGMMLGLFSMMALYVGIQILYFVFPQFVNLFELDNLMKAISNQDVYAISTDIGRTAVFTKLSPIIVRWAGNDALLFGIGLGNGDYSSTFSFLNSTFFTTYELTHYTWLSLGYLFVETGFLGVISYVSFFVVLEIKAILAYQKRNTYYNLLGTFFPMAFMILLVYNSAARSNYAYMIFVTLAWQTIADNIEQKKEEVYD